MDVFGSLVCLSAIKMEGEDAPGGFLFFKAIDARGSQTDSRTTSKTNSNGAMKGVGGWYCENLQITDQIYF